MYGKELFSIARDMLLEASTQIDRFISILQLPIVHIDDITRAHSELISSEIYAVSGGPHLGAIEMIAEWLEALSITGSSEIRNDLTKLHEKISIIRSVRSSVIQGFKQAQLKLLSAIREESNKFIVSVSQLRDDLFGAKGPIQSLANVTFAHDASTPFRILQSKVGSLQQQLLHLHDAETASELPHTDGKELEFLDQVVDRYSGLFDLYDDFCDFIKASYVVPILELTKQVKVPTVSTPFQFSRASTISELHKCIKQYENFRSRMFGLVDGCKENALYEWMKSLASKHLTALQILAKLQHIHEMSNLHWKEWKEHVADEVFQSNENIVGTMIRPTSAFTSRASERANSAVISFLRPWKTIDMCEDVFVGDILECLEGGFPANELFDIAERAAQENAASNILKRINFEWTTEEFVFVHEDTNRAERQMLQILDIQWARRKLLQMDDDLISLCGILLKSMQKDVDSWRTRLFNARSSLQHFLIIQDEWLKYRYYLRTLSALHRSNVIEQQLLGLFTQMRDRPNVIEFCSDGIFSGSILPALAGSLEDIRKSLVAVLDSYRGIFSRLNFVDDADIVDMQHFLSVKPAQMDKMFPLLFTGIAKIVIHADTTASRRREAALSYGAALDASGSMLPFTAAGIENTSASIPIDRSLPVFLSTLCHAMQGTVSQQISDVMDTLATQNIKNFSLQQSDLDKLCNFSSQAANIGLRCLWTTTCENAIDQAGKSEVSSSLTLKPILRSIQLNIGLATENVKLQRMRSQNILLCSLFLNLRDATEKLEVAAPKMKEDFDFSMTLRHYHASETQRQSSWVSMMDTNFLYGYEWEGSKSRLVTTPHSLRVLLSIFQALRGGFGAELTRPSFGRSGLTEELACLLGSFCCFKRLMPIPSENITFEVRRALRGVSRNEFHSVLAFEDLHLLTCDAISIVCSQIRLLLHQYVAEGGGFCIIPSVEITTIPPILCFRPPRPFYLEAVTIPECVRQIFRPAGSWLSKSLDRVHILSVILASHAVQDHNTVSRKINTICDLCYAHPIMSKKSYMFTHAYAIKIVKYLIGAVRQNEEGEILCNELLLDAFQCLICIHLEPEELKIFEIMARLITGNKNFQFHVLMPDDHSIEESIIKNLESKKFQRNPAQVHGIRRLLESVLSRCAVVVVGPPQSGKTTYINQVKPLLVDRITGMSRIQNLKICPTSTTLQRLFGKCNAEGGLTRWLKEQQPTADITVSVVEFESGTMDRYCLEMLVPMIYGNEYHIPNSCRMGLRNTVKFIFEVEGLGQLTPAIAGQFGFFTASPAVVQAEHLIRSWQSRSTMQSITAHACSLLEIYFASTIKFCLKEIVTCIRIDEERMESATILAMQRALRILDAGITKFFSVPTPSFPADSYREVLERLVAFSTVWGLAGMAQDSNERRKFSLFMQHATSIVLPSEFRDEDCLHDWFIDDTGVWQSWSKSFGIKDQMDEFFGDSNILVPTSEMCCQHSILMLLGMYKEQNSLFRIDDGFEKGCKGIFVFGRQGCGKSVVLKSVTNNISKESTTAHIGMYSSLTSHSLQLLLEHYLTYKNGTFVVKEDNRFSHDGYGRTDDSNHLFLLIEDVNLAKGRECDCPLSFIRSLLSENAGLFASESKFSQAWVGFDAEITTICSFTYANNMQLSSSEYVDGPESKLSGIDMLYNKSFAVNMTNPTQNDIYEICRTILERLYGQVFSADLACLDCIGRATVSMVSAMASLFPSSASRCHCIYDIRRIFEVMNGMQLACKVSNIPELVNLWLHECKRSFLDRANPSNDETKSGVKIIAAMAVNTRAEQDLSLLNFVEECCFDEENIAKIEFSFLGESTTSLQQLKLHPITDNEGDGSRNDSEEEDIDFSNSSPEPRNKDLHSSIQISTSDDVKIRRYCECTDATAIKNYLLKCFGVARARKIFFTGEVYLFEGSVLFLSRLHRAVKLVFYNSECIIIVERMTGNALNSLKLVTCTMTDIALMDLTSTYCLVHCALDIAKQAALQNAKILMVCSADQESIIQELLNLMDFGRLDMYLDGEDTEYVLDHLAASNKDGLSAFQLLQIMRKRITTNLRLVVCVQDLASHATEDLLAIPSFLFFYPDLASVSKRAIVLFEPGMEPNDFVGLAKRCVEKVSRSLGREGLPIPQLALHLGAIPMKAVGSIKLDNPIDEKRRNAQIVCSSRYALFLREFQRIMLAKARGLQWRHGLLYNARERIGGVEVRLFLAYLALKDNSFVRVNYFDLI